MKKPAKDILLVSMQALLFLAYFWNAKPINFVWPTIVRYTGIVLSLAGFAVALSAILLLNKRLTPFPTPVADAILIKSGPFRFIRHPIYTGILAIAFGYAFFSQNTWRVLIALMLWILFEFKSRYEEQLLNSRFPCYRNYMTTTGRFLPRFNW